MNKGLLLSSILVGVGGTVFLLWFLDGFIAFVPLMALGIILIFALGTRSPA